MLTESKSADAPLHGAPARGMCALCTSAGAWAAVARTFSCPPHTPALEPSRHIAGNHSQICKSKQIWCKNLQESIKALLRSNYGLEWQTTPCSLRDAGQGGGGSQGLASFGLSLLCSRAKRPRQLPCKRVIMLSLGTQNFGP